MNKSKSGIYKIEHTASGKLYVGSALHIGRRWDVHIRLLRRGLHHSVKMQRAWIKYGEDAFIFSILENVEAPEMLLEVEQKWLDLTHAATRGYNMTPTAGSLYGYKFSDETKIKMSASASGKIRSESHRKSLSIVNTGKVMSPESREKMRLAKLGKKRPPHSEETKAKMSAVKMGKKPTDETRIKLSLAKLGRAIPDDVRAKMSASHKARIAKK